MILIPLSELETLTFPEPTPIPAVPGTGSSSLLPLGPQIESEYWRTMETYFMDIKESDLKILQPQPANAADPAFLIPPLGRHFAEIWANEDARAAAEDDPDHMARIPSGSGRARARFSDLVDETQRDKTLRGLLDGDFDMPIDPSAVPPHSLSARVLGAFISDKAATDLAIKNSATSTSTTTTSTSATTSPSAIAASRQAVRDSIAAPNLYAGPISSQWFDPSARSLLSERYEDRVFVELKSIGLVDERVGPEDWQDDEVCVHLRRLQGQLKEQQKANSGMKSRLLSSVIDWLPTQRKLASLKDIYGSVERLFSKLVASKKDSKNIRKTREADVVKILKTVAMVEDDVADHLAKHPPSQFDLFEHPDVNALRAPFYENSQQHQHQQQVPAPTASQSRRSSYQGPPSSALQQPTAAQPHPPNSLLYKNHHPNPAKTPRGSKIKSYTHSDAAAAAVAASSASIQAGPPQRRTNKPRGRKKKVLHEV